MEVEVIHVLVVKVIAAAGIGEREIHVGEIDAVGDVMFQLRLVLAEGVVESKPMHLLVDVAVGLPVGRNLFALGLGQRQGVRRLEGKDLLGTTLA